MAIQGLYKVTQGRQWCQSLVGIMLYVLCVLSRGHQLWQLLSSWLWRDGCAIRSPVG